MTFSLRKTIILAITLAFVAGIAFTSSAQKSKITIEDLYTDYTFSAEGISALRWLEDSKGYSTLVKNEEVGGRDIVRTDAVSGKTKVLVSANQLIPKGDTTALSIRNYIWSADNSKVLIFTNTRKVWRRHTRGDYWVLELKSGKLTQIAPDMNPARLMFAKFSPDAKNVGFVYFNNIYVQSLETNKIEQLTTDGNDIIVNGTFDWAYEEELNCRDGYRWSPDNKTISFWRSNTEGMGTFYLINNIDSVYPKLTALPYPKVGTPSSSVKIGAINLADKKITWMDIPGDKREHYLARMEWAQNSDELIIQQLNRPQNTNKVFFANAKTGTAKLVYTEKVDTWLDVYNDMTWLNDDKEFTWLSDNTGWLHLNKISRTDGKMTPITSGDYEVVTLLNVEPKSGWAYFMASPENGTQLYLYRSKLDGTGQPERLTPKDEAGYHSYKLSENGKYAIHDWSNATTPSTYEVVELPSHKVIRVLEDNKELKETLAKYAIPQKEFIKIKTAEAEFDAWIIKPIDFDPNKKYPLLFYVYGEPAGCTVEDYYGDFWHPFLAQEGYIVMSIDNRGTPQPRGREWRKSVYEKIGVISSYDQAACARKIIEWDFIDKERVGIWGWSGGGSSTLQAMFRYPEIYKTGIAIAFISDQRVYDNIYQERYMNTLDKNEAGYIEGSPITHVEGLEGNLLLMYGSADDNCHYQNCQMLVDQLIKHNKYFTMIDYPLRDHGIWQRENTTMHLRMTMLRFLNLNLPAGGVSSEAKAKGEK
ncbi:MAG: S9 family peptidase [Flavobacteriales bacterium]|nr:S9 family peptidase [Flavobacteriales bacterium]